jgi:serine/threonine-protein kinase/endoribonuclease IRE1
MLIGTATQKLILSLLDGRLISVDLNTGRVLWSLNEDPILSMTNSDTARLNFFPNPKDGSIYIYNELKERLERLTLTIPELAQISPTRSSDGLLFTAMKSDVWFEIDPLSGTKLHTISSGGTVSPSCPASEMYAQTIFIARTAYTVSVYDSVSKEKRWGTTYLEYSSFSYPSSLSTDHLYFSSTSDGTFVSIDSLTGTEMWRNNYNSAVLSVFVLEHWQLRKVPIYTVSLEGITLHKDSSKYVDTKAFGAMLQVSWPTRCISPLSRTTTFANAHDCSYYIGTVA